MSLHEQQQLKREVTARLQQHRTRRPAPGSAQAVLPQMETFAPAQRSQGRGVADSVAARYANKASYRDLLAQEAEAALHQAEAAAEVARRNADAIAGAQQRLLDDIAHWNTAGVPMHGPAEVAAHGESPAVLADVLSFAEHVPAPQEQQFSATPHTVGAAVLPEIERQAVHVSQPVFADAFAEAMTATSGTLFEGTTYAPEPLTGLPTNLIEFPRQLLAARKARPRLAEGPLRDEADAAPERAQLRIFEVEANTFSTVPLAVTESVLPEWSNIRLDNWQPLHETASPDAQVTLALPLYTAPVEARCMAAAVDVTCIGTTFLLATAVAGSVAGELPTGLMAVGAAAGSLAMLTAMYLLIFFTLTEATPGMRYARIALCTFSDDNPTRAAMRRRLLAMVLSLIPLGLGFAWACLDDDRLGWHDRISRMYQRAY